MTKSTSFSHRIQRGFLLLETALALIIIAVTGALALNSQLSSLLDAKAVAQGKAMLQVQNAANSYITTYAGQLSSNTPITLSDGSVLTTIYTPTIADLNKLNVGLSTNFSEKALIGGIYQIQIKTNPSPCAATRCEISAIAWITQPLLENGRIDYPRLTVAAREMGADGALSTDMNTDGTISTASAASIRGVVNIWSETNPAGNIAGILAVRAGYDSQIMNQFLRRDGQSLMTGDLQLGNGFLNNDIVNLKDVTADNTIQGATINTSGAASSNVVNATTTVNAGSFNASGSLTASTVSSTGQITGDTITSANRVTANEFVKINGTVTEDQACAKNGLLGVDAIGTMLTCQNGAFNKAVKTPHLHRFVFNASQKWTVPDGVQSAFVTMAGGGGSGVGWRIVNSTTSGPSGGYVFSQPVNLTPGETIDVVVGTGGQSFRPVQSNVIADPGLPYYVMEAPQGDDGLGGYPGTPSKLVNSAGGVLLECDGGSGAFYGGVFSDGTGGPGVDSYSGSAVVSNLPGVTVGSGRPKYHTPGRLASGPYISYAGPGACGAGGYGIGNPGITSYVMSTGSHAGGRTPFGYGSGGDTYVNQCYVTRSQVGTCIYPDAGRDGVVYLDVIY